VIFPNSKSLSSQFTSG